MKTYRALVRVGRAHVWAQVSAQGPDVARLLLEAQYGRGNVVGVPVLAA